MVAKRTNDATRQLLTASRDIQESCAQSRMARRQATERATKERHRDIVYDSRKRIRESRALLAKTAKLATAHDGA